jgi:hypothetical protein
MSATTLLSNHSTLRDVIWEREADRDNKDSCDYYMRLMRLFEGEIPTRLNTVREAVKPALYRQVSETSPLSHPLSLTLSGDAFLSEFLVVYVYLLVVFRELLCFCVCVTYAEAYPNHSPLPAPLFLRSCVQYQAPRIVIEFASAALGVVNNADPRVPVLWANIFKYSLNLGNNDNAFAAIIGNPDPDARNDCLQRFGVCLCLCLCWWS